MASKLTRLRVHLASLGTVPLMVKLQFARATAGPEERVSGRLNMSLVDNKRNKNKN